MVKTNPPDGLFRITKRGRALLYRLRVGGMGLFIRHLKEVFSRHLKRLGDGSSIHQIGEPGGSFRILYVHSGWAIYNVGLCWFSGLEGVSCTMVSTEDFVANPALELSHDIVMFGYTDIMQRCQHLSLTRPLVVCVHDPLELFDQVVEWKQFAPYSHAIDLYKRAERVLCISHEMQRHLASAGIVAVRVPTASLLPATTPTHIRCKAVAALPLRAITVGRIYPRKRFELFNEIARVSQREGLPVTFEAKLDDSPLPEQEYISYLDNADIYIVTSFQEGGPLPAMDAMRRGLAVLSTAVGQMQEIIEDGISGFLCNNLSEFVGRLKLISRDRELLERMQHQSLARILDVRSDVVVRSALMAALRFAEQHCKV